MDNTFPNCEKLYRAVFPESYMQMFWRKDGRMPGSVYTLPVPAILSSQALNTKNQRNVYFGCADYC